MKFVRFIRALRIALLGIPHRHKWETLETRKVHDHKGRWTDTDYVLHCKGCGDIKKRRV